MNNTSNKIVATINSKLKIICSMILTVVFSITCFFIGYKIYSDDMINIIIGSVTSGLTIFTFMVLISTYKSKDKQIDMIDYINIVTSPIIFTSLFMIVKTFFCIV